MSKLLSFPLLHLFLLLLFNFNQCHEPTDYFDSGTVSFNDVDRVVRENQDEPAQPNLKERLSSANDVASLLNLDRITKLKVNVPVNLIFIGFEGDGNHYLYLQEEEFVEYFQHIEHFLPHVVVPVGEEQTTTLKYVTPKTHVTYEIGWNVLRLYPLVNTILEDVIMWHLRSENKIPTPSSSSKKTLYYVDSFKFSTVLNNLLHFLNLTESYTLFILNPKFPFDDDTQSYGYRTGFSDLEIQTLQANETFMSKKIVLKPPPKIRKATQDLGYKKQKMDVENPDIYGLSEEWARWYIKTQKDGNWTEEGCSDGEEDDWKCLFSARRNLYDGRKDIVELALQLADSGTHFEQTYLQSIQNSAKAAQKSSLKSNFPSFSGSSSSSPNLHEDCLVDAWMSHERFAFIDLTAGPFEWGPVVAGEGVRSPFTIPSVPHRTFNDIPKKAKSKITDLEDMRKLFWKQCVRYGRIAKMGKCMGLHGAIMKLMSEVHPLMRMGQQQLDDFIEGKDEGPKDKLRERKNAKKEDAGKGEEAPEQVEDEGAAIHGAVNGMEKERKINQFFSSLSNVISISLRHLFVPPAPLYPSTYAERVVFNFFQISNHNQFPPLDPENFDFEHFKQEVMKLKLPQQEFVFTQKKILMKRDPEVHTAYVNSLKYVVLPRLTIQGEFHPATHLYIDTRELRHQFHLKNLSLIGGNSGSEEVKKQEAKSRVHKNVFNYEQQLASDEEQDIVKVYREIPIFFFSLDSKVPVYVDKYYQAKALKDMVVIVQSNFTEVESRLYCNKKPIHWNLRGPLKHALSSVGLILGGLIPSHISYSEARSAAEQNWLWSVGDNPMTHTSSKAHYNDVNRDMVARNYLLTGLERSVSRVNKLIDLLASRSIDSIRPQLNDSALQSKLKLEEVMDQYNMLIGNWVDAIFNMEVLDFPEAIKSMTTIHLNTKKFQTLATHLLSSLNLLCCQSKEKEVESITPKLTISSNGSGWWEWMVTFDWWIFTCLVFDFLMVALYLILRGRKGKMKMN